MGKRKFRLSTGLKNAERKQQESKQREPGRPKKRVGKPIDDAESASNSNGPVIFKKICCKILFKNFFYSRDLRNCARV